VKRPPILLAHVGAHHLARLAEGLARSELLDAFVTGICFRLPHEAPEPSRSRLAKLSMRIGSARLFRFWHLGLLSLYPQRLMPATLRKYWNHWVWWRFGSAAARVVERCEPRIVIAFENSALEPFRSAKATDRRVACVLECPSVHHARQSYGALSAMGRRLVRRIDVRKSEEIELADRIIVLSSFAKSTFVDAGVPAQKIEVIPLGVDSCFFAQRPLPPRKPLRFLFAGTASYGKGVDLLVSAFPRLKGDCELRFVGVTTPDLVDSLRGVARCTTTGPVGRAAMRDELAAAHVLVLPSRFDGFGMVVSEAMATGRPAIVSDHVGAADVVVHDGPSKSGWIVPAGDVEALAAAMQDAISRADELESMASAARLAMEGLSWERYYRSLEAIYRRIDADQDNAER
jgi:glycosyltransferase involved in cell wall biosynthesis